MVQRFTMRRTVAGIVAAYFLMLAGSISWHWLGPPPYARPTIGLALALGVTAALVGSICIWCAFAATHWSGRASGLIASTAVLIGVPTLFFEWDNSLVWQLLVIMYVQLATLSIVLGLMRIFGYTIGTDDATSAIHPEGKRIHAAQFTVRNLFLMTSALALTV